MPQSRNKKWYAHYKGTQYRANVHTVLFVMIISGIYVLNQLSNLMGLQYPPSNSFIYE